MPNYLGTKVLGAKDIIHDRARQMHSVTVAMKEDASIIRNNSAYFAQTFEEEGRIFFLRRPKIIKRKLPGAISWCKTMNFLSEERRVEVCKVHRPALHPLQNGQAVTEVYLDISLSVHFLVPVS